MKIVDHAGNSIKVGRLLRWQPKDQLDLYVKVVDVVSPTKDMPGHVTFTANFSIQPTAKEQGAIQFKDFVTVFDPEDELRAEMVLAKTLESLPKGPVAVPDPLSKETEQEELQTRFGGGE